MVQPCWFIRKSVCRQVVIPRSSDFHALLRLEAIWSSHAGLSGILLCSTAIIFYLCNRNKYKPGPVSSKNTNLRTLGKFYRNFLNDSYETLKIIYLNKRASVFSFISLTEGLAGGNRRDIIWFDCWFFRDEIHVNCFIYPSCYSLSFREFRL